jgi:hypothetical protein
VSQRSAGADSRLFIANAQYMLASLRKLSRDLAVWLMHLCSPSNTITPGDLGGFHPPEGVKDK